MSFVCSCSINAQSITGNWNLTWLLIEGDMVYSIIVPITVTITDDRRVSGNGGCNSFDGKYSFKKPKKPFKKPLPIKFTDIIATQMSCEKSSKVEAVFFRSLREAQNVFIEDGVLQIDGPKNGNHMTFAKETRMKP